MNKTLIASLLLLPLIASAQLDGATRIKKKAVPNAAASQDPDVNFTPFVPVALEAAPATSTCEKPPLVRTFVSQEKADKFKAALNNYQACMKDYVDANSKAANQHAEASNTAVAEANAYFNELNNLPDKAAAD